MVSPEETEDRRVLMSRAPNQRVSRIPGMHDLCRKVPFAVLMMRKSADDPEAFNFHPKTVILPQGAAIAGGATAMREGVLKTGTAIPNLIRTVPAGHPAGLPGRGTGAATAMREGVFKTGTAILKPDDGTQGDGIYLVATMDEAKRRMETTKMIYLVATMDEAKRRMETIKMESAVLQRYITKPLLLDVWDKFVVATMDEAKRRLETIKMESAAKRRMETIKMESAVL
ncbi:hypothetical protein T484DRAFT_1835408 [Baffinella frigidus]|nr:hypothetical protein T484DRAFT_1835408 [Cryptophyta sp. CCMP2293]